MTYEEYYIKTLLTGDKQKLKCGDKVFFQWNIEHKKGEIPTTNIGEVRQINKEYIVIWLHGKENVWPIEHCYKYEEL